MIYPVPERSRLALGKRRCEVEKEKEVGETTGRRRVMGPGEHGGDLYLLENLGIKAEEILDFSANVNPLGPPAGVWEALRQGLDSIERYPDPYSRRLTGELARSLGLPPENILVTNGASEFISLLFLALRPRRVLMWAPSYVSYARAARLVGSEVVYSSLSPENDFQPDLKDLLTKAAAADLVILGHPHNPTGRLLENTHMEELISYACKRGIFLVVDESFIDLAGDDRTNRVGLSLRAKLPGCPRLAIIYSLTKNFALPGLRLGCGLAAAELLASLRGWQVEWSVNGLAQIAGVAALRSEGYLEESRRFIARERAFLEEGLQELPGLRPYPAAANFLLVGVGDSPYPAREWWLRLARQGILVRDCRNFVGLGDGFIRVAVRCREENARLLAALRAILAAEV